MILFCRWDVYKTCPELFDTSSFQRWELHPLIWSMGWTYCLNSNRRWWKWWDMSLSRLDYKKTKVSILRSVHFFQIILSRRSQSPPCEDIKAKMWGENHTQAPGEPEASQQVILDAVSPGLIKHWDNCNHSWQVALRFLSHRNHREMFIF